jgi:polar amino acid transport system substrate-binding protein
MLAGISIAFACSSVFGQTLRLCNDEADSSPWIVKNEKGLNIVLMEEAASRVGIKLDIQPLPWRRCMLAVQEKAVDGAIAASFNEERTAFAHYPTLAKKLDISRRLHTDEYSLYQSKGGKLTWNGSAFSHLHGAIGAQRGYSVVGDLKKLGAQVEEGGTFPIDNMRKLITGQVQAVALTTQEGDALLAHPDFAGKIEKITPQLVQKHYFTIIGKDYYQSNTKTVEALWSAMATIRESKAYQAKVTAAFKNK